jgi:hypothetical protein
MSINATALYPWLQTPSGGLNLAVNDGSRLEAYFNTDVVVGSSGVDVDFFDVNCDSTSLINDLRFYSTSTIASIKTARFGNNGLKLYANTGSAIQEYTLSAAYDVSTSSYIGQLSTTGTTGTIKDFDLSPDGTKLMILGTTSNSVYEYSLGTAYSITTSTYNSRAYALTSQDADMRFIHFANSGLRFITLGYNNDAIYQYTCGTAFNLTSVTFNTSLNLSSYITNPTSDGLYQHPMAVSADGLRIIITYLTGSSATPGMWYREIKLSDDCLLSGALSGIRSRCYRDSTNAINPCIFDISPEVDGIEYLILGNSNTGSFNLRTLTNNKLTKILVKGFAVSGIDTIRYAVRSITPLINGADRGGLTNDLNLLYQIGDRFSVFESAGSTGRVPFFVPYQFYTENSLKLRAKMSASSNNTGLTIVTFYDRV